MEKLQGNHKVGINQMLPVIYISKTGRQQCRSGVLRKSESIGYVNFEFILNEYQMTTKMALCRIP